MLVAFFCLSVPERLERCVGTHPEKLWVKIPNYFCLSAYLGIVYQRHDTMALAKVAFAQAIRVNPNFADAYLALLQLHLRTQTFDQAIDVAQQLLAMQPHNAVAHLALGRAYLAKGHVTQAVTAIRTAIEQAPREAQGYQYVRVGVPCAT